MVKKSLLPIELVFFACKHFQTFWKLDMCIENPKKKASEGRFSKINIHPLLGQITLFSAISSISIHFNSKSLHLVTSENHKFPKIHFQLSPQIYCIQKTSVLLYNKYYMDKYMKKYIFWYKNHI